MQDIASLYNIIEINVGESQVANVSVSKFKRPFLVSGRVHSAVVSGVNWEQRTVTVEWFERGETKGKEVIMIPLLSFAK